MLIVVSQIPQDLDRCLKFALSKNWLAFVENSYSITALGRSIVQKKRGRTNNSQEGTVHVADGDSPGSASTGEDMGTDLRGPASECEDVDTGGRGRGRGRGKNPARAPGKKMRSSNSSVDSDRHGQHVGKEIQINNIPEQLGAQALPSGATEPFVLCAYAISLPFFPPPSITSFSLAQFVTFPLALPSIIFLMVEIFPCLQSRTRYFLHVRFRQQPGSALSCMLAGDFT
jgi:hypothetical protein